jgi:cyclopropane-fatty-acyl-phospholipid synthase
MSVLGHALNLVERGRVPDGVVRWGIRRLCRHRLREIETMDAAGAEAAVDDFARTLRDGPIAPVPEKANEQHYEVPAAFFRHVLGKHRKYSSAYFPAGVTSLDEAEFAALHETCHRAGLADGMDVLELGCGWGSLTLWMAEHYPNARITAVSNSASQRAFILDEAAARGLDNLRVITADMNAFDTDERFDRVISVEMFEHMCNYETLLDRIAGWLRPEGRLFVHIFCHARAPYRFETDGDANWMGRHFFTGGIMPCAELFSRFDERLIVTRQWRWDGTHYQRTADAWLRNLTRHRDTVMPILAEAYGAQDAVRWYHRWRVFFMACAELFGYAGGREWGVEHYLFAPRSKAVTRGPERSTRATVVPGAAAG